jgi:hypothetical protein
VQISAAVAVLDAAFTRAGAPTTASLILELNSGDSSQKYSQTVVGPSSSSGALRDNTIVTDSHQLENEPRHTVGDTLNTGLQTTLGKESRETPQVP